MRGKEGHRKAHVYFGDGSSYRSKHQAYKAFQFAAGLAFVGLNLFLNLLRLVHPSIRKSKTNQDVCNVCSRLDVEIKDTKQQLKAARGAREIEWLEARLDDLTKQRERHLGSAGAPNKQLGI